MLTSIILSGITALKTARVRRIAGTDSVANTYEKKIELNFPVILEIIN